MTIWAIKNPEEEDQIKFVADSLRQGRSRFGWSFGESNLYELEKKDWEELDDDQIESYKRANFLLEVQPGDWVVHINVPYWGACLAAEVAARYSFDSEQEEEPGVWFRHTLPIKLDTLIEFERNDENLLPSINRRLKLQGRYWRIRQEDEFKQSIANLTNRTVVLAPNQRAETYHFRNDIAPFFSELTVNIQKNNPGSKLEEFIAEILRKVPGITSVEENGKHKGWGSDYGADLIAYYETGLPALGIRREGVLVVQVKSYIDTHETTKAIDEVKTGIKHFSADAGLIISTAQPSNNFKKAFEIAGTELAEQGKTIGLIAGDDVAKFVLRFGGDIIL